MDTVRPLEGTIWTLIGPKMFMKRGTVDDVVYIIVIRRGTVNNVVYRMVIIRGT